MRVSRATHALPVENDALATEKLSPIKESIASTIHQFWMLCHRGRRLKDLILHHRQGSNLW